MYKYLKKKTFTLRNNFNLTKLFYLNLLLTILHYYIVIKGLQDQVPSEIKFESPIIFQIFKLILILLVYKGYKLMNLNSFEHCFLNLFHPPPTLRIKHFLAPSPPKKKKTLNLSSIMHFKNIYYNIITYKHVILYF